MKLRDELKCSFSISLTPLIHVQRIYLIILARGRTRLQSSLLKLLSSARQVSAIIFEIILKCDAAIMSIITLEFLAKEACSLLGRKLSRHL